MRVAAFLIATFVVASAASQKVRFDNYSVYRVTPKNAQQLQSLKSLEGFGGYSFWTEVGKMNTPVDIMVPPHLKADFKDVLELTGIPSETFIEDVQQLVEKSERKTRGSVRSVGWTDYNTVDEV